MSVGVLDEETPYVTEDLTEEEAYLFAILTDESGLDQAEFLIYDPACEDNEIIVRNEDGTCARDEAGQVKREKVRPAPSGCFRAWDFQVWWWRNPEMYQIDQCARALDVRTPVPTPNGWTTMGELAPGSEVFDADGRPTLVTAVSEVWNDRDCYEVFFSDHSSIVADGDHLWETWDKKARAALNPKRRGVAKPRVVTTNEIRSTLRYGVEANHAVDVAGPLDMPEGDLPVDPYFLGYWLGDGNTNDSDITTADAWVLEELERRGIETTPRATGLYRHGVRYSRRHNQKTESVQAHLRRAGVLGSKHIPVAYLRSSERQRREVLAGLVDSDGHMQLNGSCEITQKCERLARDLLELLRSLGETPRVSKRRATLDGVDMGPVYRVTWRPQANPALMPRKAERFVRPREGGRLTQRRIIDVRPVPSRPVRCITVASERHLFLAGESMVPTHNSVGKSQSILVRGCAFPFVHPGLEMVVTAPELIHLEPIVSKIEQQFYTTWFLSQMLPRGKSAVTHRPFQMNFLNGARIIGRIPQRDGKGVKGCPTGDTPILTKQGMKFASEVRVGDELLSHAGKWQKVTGVYEDHNDCYEVKGQGSFPMTVSCDHRFLGATNEAGPKQARSLSALGWHDVELLKPLKVYWASPTAVARVSIPDVDLPVGDERFWWLVGRWLADGYLSLDKKNSKARKVHWVVHPDDQGELLSALEVLDRKARVVGRSHSSADSVEVGHAGLHRFLGQHFDQHADGKRLPTFVYSLDAALRRRLLDGYLAGDGYRNDARHRWEVGSASKLLAVGVHLLAQMFGHTVNCSVVQPKVTHVMGVPLKGKPRSSWRLQIMDLGHGHPAEVSGWRVSKVKSVEKVGVQKVYDIRVEEDHSYLSGSIMSHNIHPIWLELDEAQDYPKAGWKELTETLKRGVAGARWRAHGVTRGVRDDFYEKTQDSSNWFVHRFPAMWRPNWTDKEREDAIAEYDSRDDPDYRRNVLGLHGDATNPIFVLTQLMKCWYKEVVVLVKRGGKICSIPVKDVRVGDVVINALGEGVVQRVIPSQHRKLLELTVESERLYCTPDHRVLSSRGWIEAGKLEPGDELATHEGLRALWGGLSGQRQEVLLEGVLAGGQSGAGGAGAPALQGLREADRGARQDVLLDRVPGREGSGQEGAGVPPVRGALEGRPDEVLQLPVLRGIQAGASAGRCLPSMREGARGERPAQVLQQDLRVRPSFAGADRGPELRAVRQPTRAEAAALLLEAVCREARWADLSGLGDAEAHDDFMRALWRRVLPGVEEGPVLLPEVRSEGSLGAGSSAGSGLREVRGLLQASKADSSVLLHGVLVRGEEGRETSVGAALDEQGGVGRAPQVPVALVEGSWSGRGRVVRQSSSHARRVSPWRDLPTPRRGSSADSGLPRGRRPGALRDERGVDGTRQAAGRLASFARVDRVEVLEPGHPEFDRLSTGTDRVDCYDLTVSGHPSFCVGEAGIVAHNCVDNDPLSDYNAGEYFKQVIKSEELELLRVDITHFLDFPAGHLAYLGDAAERKAVLEGRKQPRAIYWVGMDVGFTIDPSEILIFVEYREKPRDPVTKLRLLSRLSLWRMPVQQQVMAMLAVIDFYRPKVFALDRNGIGLPLWQLIQDHLDAFKARDLDKIPAWFHGFDLERAATSIKGYTFGQNLIVDFDKTIEVGRFDDAVEKAGMKREAKAYSTDQLRELVDQSRLWLPWDEDFLKQFQGATWTAVKGGIDQYGRRMFCVDEETECLARGKGWIRYHELEVGDQVWAGDPATDQMSWSPVTAVNVFDGPNEVIEMRNRTHSSVTTPNHRWLVDRHRPWRDDWLREWRTTEDLRGRIRLPRVGAPAEGGVERHPDWFVELVAWAWTEGHFDSRENGYLRISQSSAVNPSHCERIRACLRQSGDDWSERDSEGKVVWNVRSALGARLLSVMDLQPGRGDQRKVVKSSFLHELTTDQLEIFVETCLDADGFRSGGVTAFVQKRLERVRVFEEACALAGRPTHTHQYSINSGPYAGWKGWHCTLLTTDHWSVQQMLEGRGTMERRIIDGPVWCPTTATGTWLARRDGSVYLTGNSKGNDHCLDAAREMALGWAQYSIEETIAAPKARVPVLDTFVEM